MDQPRWPRRPTSDMKILRGYPLPLGATVHPDGMNFAVASRYATAVTLLVFLPGTLEPLLEVALDGRFHRTGEVWHAFLKGLDPGIPYAFRMDRVPNPAPHLRASIPVRSCWTLTPKRSRVVTRGAFPSRPAQPTTWPGRPRRVRLGR